MDKFSYGHAVSVRSFDRGPQFTPHRSNQRGAGHGRGLGSGFAGSISAVAHGAQTAIGILLGWNELARQRYQLAALDDHVLRDIGVERDAAQREAARPFWVI